jgi:hypothetical protein
MTTKIQQTVLKVKFPLFLAKHQAMKMYWGNGGIAPRVLNMMAVNGQLHAPAALLSE